MKVMDLFSGIGGFTLGLNRAGMDTVMFCENEDSAIKVLNKNFPNIPINKDIRNLSLGWINEKEIGSVDVVCGGFPCQDVSIAGKRSGIEGGERSVLWYDFKRVINEVRPKYAIIENVCGLLSKGLEIVLSDLAKIGYDATWTTIDSQYCGVPQRRRRVYILAVRDGIPEGADIFGFAERCNENIRVKMENIQKGRSWNYEEGDRIKEPFAYFTRQRSDQFACSGVSGTIAKRDYKSFTDLVVDKDGIRRVTPEERLLLQGFPEDYFDGCGLSDKEKFQLNGMTVNAVEWIGRGIVEFEKYINNKSDPWCR